MITEITTCVLQRPQFTYSLNNTESQWIERNRVALIEYFAATGAMVEEYDEPCTFVEFCGVQFDLTQLRDEAEDEDEYEAIEPLGSDMSREAIAADDAGQNARGEI